MRWTLFLLLAACLDFHEAYETCQQPGGRCGTPTAGGGESAGGTSGGASSSGGAAGGTNGGSSSSGGTAGGGTAGGGTSAGGGSVGGGAGGGATCATCTSPLNGACLTVPGANERNDHCGTGGVQCVDCAMSGGVCERTTLTCKRWSRIPTSGLERPFVAVRAHGPGEAFFGSELGRFVRTRSERVTVSTYLPSGTGDIKAFAGAGDSLLVASLWGTNLGRVGTYDVSDGGPLRTESVDFSGFVPISVSWVGTHQLLAGQALSPRTARVYSRADGGWSNITPSSIASLTPAAAYEVIAQGAGAYLLLLSDGRVGRAREGLSGFSPMATVPAAGWMTTSPNGVAWVVGGGSLARVDDAGVQFYDAGDGMRLSAVWAPADDLVFVAGREPSGSGVIVRVDSRGLSRTLIPAPALIGIHGWPSPLEIWATDLDGGIWRYSDL